MSVRLSTFWFKKISAMIMGTHLKLCLNVTSNNFNWYLNISLTLTLVLLIFKVRLRQSSFSVFIYFIYFILLTILIYMYMFIHCPQRICCNDCDRHTYFNVNIFHSISEDFVIFNYMSSHFIRKQLFTLFQKISWDFIYHYSTLLHYISLYFILFDWLS